MATAIHPTTEDRAPQRILSAFRTGRTARGRTARTGGDRVAEARPAGPRQGGQRPARRDSGARSARRDVEATMTGAPIGSPGSDDRWSACWERGMRSGLPPAELFDQLAALHGDVVVLHGLPVAGTSRVIDHVLVGPGGVVVAATEDRAGRVRTDGVRLRVAGRDCSSIVDLALWQAEVVRMTLAARGHAGVPVHGVLHWCDVDALGSRAVALRGIPLLSAGAATCMAAAGLELSPLAVARITTVLATGHR